MDVEFRLLRCAIALAEHHNFARAAKAVHMSQPSLSRNIQELERRLGVQLFSRNHRGADLTSAGVIFLEQAQDIMSRASDLVREMDLLKGLQKGELSIGAGVYPGPMFVDKAIGRLVHDHPAARVFVTYQNAFELLPRLLSRELDFTVMYLADREILPQLQVTKLKPHSLYFVARTAHPILSRRGKLYLDQVLEYPLTTVSRIPSTMARRFVAANPKRSSSLKLGASVACDSLAMMKTIVAESDAIGIFPLNVVLSELEDGKMAVLPLDEPAGHGSFSIVRLHHRSLSPLGEKLAQLVVDADNEFAQFEQQIMARRTRTGKKLKN